MRSRSVGADAERRGVGGAWSSTPAGASRKSVGPVGGRCSRRRGRRGGSRTSRSRISGDVAERRSPDRRGSARSRPAQSSSGIASSASANCAVEREEAGRGAPTGRPAARLGDVVVAGLRGGVHRAAARPTCAPCSTPASASALSARWATTCPRVQPGQQRVGAAYVLVGEAVDGADERLVGVGDHARARGGRRRSRAHRATRAVTGTAGTTRRGGRWAGCRCCVRRWTGASA